ncbi:facilitated trehalose transporter Tret1-like [Bombyx mandarina]|uniref:Facilitated trehalose transporter Tret1-like n=1 Tax=Bombyx mandarina TaxID=7092 RepID=A0A6J2JEM3_BOMMA|nr:facilitated trehalose transporter Tret1-like [Bombyx mandarina]
MADLSDETNTYTRKPLLRQLLISTGPWNCYFMFGLCVGSPTVMIPQIRKDINSTIVINEDMASWIPAIHSYSALPWVFILPSLIRIFGRKKSYILVCIFACIGFLTHYCSKTIIHIIISEVLKGVLTASHFTVSVVIVTEYTSPRYRGVFLTLKSASFFWGILVANAIGTFFHWRNIAVLGIICSAYNLFTVIVWPESPLWLADKGRCHDCISAHRWLKGSDLISEKELKRLTSLCSEIKQDKGKINVKKNFQDFFKMLNDREFYKPVLFTILLIGLYIFSGKLICTVYSLEILKRITNDENVAYKGMLILDTVTVLSVYVGCFITKLFKRRSVLLATSSVAVIFLFSISLYLYLIKLKFILDSVYISITLLTGFTIAISSGPMILSLAISGELISLRFRSFSLCVTVLIFKSLNGTVMKFSPFTFRYFGLHGVFFIYGSFSLTFLFLLYLYLPETKDRSLQEIADSMNEKKRNVAEETKMITNDEKIIT